MSADLISLEETTEAKRPSPQDPDFFTPNGYAHVCIYRDEGGFFAQVERGSHKGPILMRQERLRGMELKLRLLGWKKDYVDLRTPIPLDNLDPVDEGSVQEELQEYPALSIPDLEAKICRAYHYSDPEDQEPVHQAFATHRQALAKGTMEYGPIDSVIDRMRPGKMVQEFSLTDICKLRHSAIFTKNYDFEQVVNSELAPLIFERIRLSAWHNHVSRLNWDEIARIYNSLRAFTVDLPGFSVDFDHTTGCNPKGYTAYFVQKSETEYHRIYADAELVFIIRFRGKPVLVISFNVSKSAPHAKPAIYIRQIQLLQKTGNRWLYKVPGHYFGYFLGRMGQAFQGLGIYLIRGEVLGEEITQNYAATLKRAQERLQKDNFFSADSRADTEKEAKVLREKIHNMRHEVIGRLPRNYGHRFAGIRRRRKTDYWKLRFLPLPQPDECPATDLAPA